MTELGPNKESRRLINTHGWCVTTEDISKHGHFTSHYEVTSWSLIVEPEFHLQRLKWHIPYGNTACLSKYNRSIFVG